MIAMESHESHDSCRTSQFSSVLFVPRGAPWRSGVSGLDSLVETDSVGHVSFSGIEM